MSAGSTPSETAARPTAALDAVPWPFAAWPDEPVAVADLPLAFRRVRAGASLWSRAHALAFWAERVPAWLAQDDALTDVGVARGLLAALVELTFGMGYDRTLIAAMQRTVAGALAASPTLRAAFVDDVGAWLAKTQPRVAYFHAGALVLFDAACVVVAHTPDDAGDEQRAAVLRVLALSAALVFQALRPAAHHVARRALTRALSKHSTAFVAGLLRDLLAPESGLPVQSGEIAAAIVHLPCAAELEEPLCNVMTQFVLGAKADAPASTVLAFGTLLARLDAARADVVLRPSLERSQRRNGARLLPRVPELVRVLPAALSVRTIWDWLAELLLDFARASTGIDAATMTQHPVCKAFAALGQRAARAKDLDGAAYIVDALNRAATDKSSPFSSVQQRSMWFAALHALGSELPTGDAALATSATSVLDTIVPILERDGALNSAIAFFATNALLTWNVHAVAKPRAALVKFLRGVFGAAKRDEPLIASLCAAAARKSQSSDYWAAFAPLAETLSKFVGLLAARTEWSIGTEAIVFVTARCAADHASFGELARKLLAPQSPLWSFVTLLMRDSEINSALARTLLLQSLMTLLQSVGDTYLSAERVTRSLAISALLNLMIDDALIHRDRLVYVEKTLSALPRFASDVLRATFFAGCERCGLPPREHIDTAVRPHAEHAATHSRVSLVHFARSLAHLLPDLRADCFVALFHPAVWSYPSHEFKVDEFCARHFGASVAEIAGMAPRVVAVCGAALLSHWTSTQQMALNCLEFCASAVPSTYPTEIIGNVVRPWLDQKALKALRAKDISIFRTPLGQLFEQPDLNVVVSQTFESLNSRLANASTLDADDLEELKRRIKREQEESRQKAIAAKRAELLAAQEQAEAEIRASVLEKYRRFHGALLCVEVIARHAPTSMAQLLDGVFEDVTTFCASPLFRVADVERVLSAVARASVPAALHPACEAVGHALRVVLRAPSGKKASPAALESCQSVIRVFSCDEYTPSAVSFHVLGPLLRFVLQQRPVSTLLDLQQAAIVLLGRHTASSQPVDLKQVYSMLFHVLGKGAPPHRKLVYPMMVAFSVGCSFDSVHDLLSGFLQPSEEARLACLEGIEASPLLRAGAPADGPEMPLLASRLWLARHDPNSSVVEIADRLYEQHPRGIDASVVEDMLKLLPHETPFVRTTAANALSTAAKELSLDMAEVIQRLVATFESYTGPAGIQIRTRCAVASVFSHLAELDLFNASIVRLCFDFFLKRGLIDGSAEVRSALVQAATDIVNSYPAVAVQDILPLVQAASSAKEVKLQETTCVLLGSIAKHLPESDKMVDTILELLLESLRNPSASVQNAVSNTLAPLIARRTHAAPKIVEDLFAVLLDAGKAVKLVHRRGAAVGLAGVVKGLGTGSLEQHGILDRLLAAFNDRDQPTSRHGALLCFEAFCTRLGQQFEESAVTLVPYLLNSFSDSNTDVREASTHASKALMQHLSGHGLRLVLPSVLAGLDSDQWRTKQGSVQLLGAMAFCAPQQLAACLPAVVPKLSDVLSDTHPKVKESATQSLRQVGSVIRNPEIQKIVTPLLDAIYDSNANAAAALTAISDASFVQEIDPASLALIMPTIHRGLKNRSMDVKRKASQVMSLVCRLATRESIVPYLPQIVPQLKFVLVDPIPEVRRFAAEAFGSLASELGEDNLPDLLEWLLKTLQSDNSTVERSGAAQGLSQVLAALGQERFELLLPDILDGLDASESFVREGTLNLLLFLPESLPNSVRKHIARLLPGVLRSVSDDNEAVREVAIRAGRIIISRFHATALDDLLPIVTDGLFDPNWRVRQSSVALLGDLLYRLGSGRKLVGETDDASALLPSNAVMTETQLKALTAALGNERRQNILASLYLVRWDPNLAVRQAAGQVWKALVPNTPRTLREVLSLLLERILHFLPSSVEEQRVVASQTLGELVRKLGDRVLVDILPFLQEQMSGAEPIRVGVAMGYVQVIVACGKALVPTYYDQFLRAVRWGLQDSAETVRTVAAEAFATLHRFLGFRVVDDVIPVLLESLYSKTSPAASERSALEGLKVVMSVRSHVVLPYLIPKLLQTPLTAFNARALAALAEVSGQSLHRHLDQIIPVLMQSFTDPNPEVAESAELAARAVVAALPVDWLHVLLGVMQQGFVALLPAMRRGAASLVEPFCSHPPEEIQDHVPALLQGVTRLFGDRVTDVALAAVPALQAICKVITPTVAVRHIKSIAECVEELHQQMRDSVATRDHRVLASLNPIYQAVIKSGSEKSRELATDSLTLLLEMTDPKVAEANLATMIGVLIRVANEKNIPKNSVLRAMIACIDAAPNVAKRFAAPLPTIFLKALFEDSVMTCSTALRALHRLLALKPRIGVIIKELVNHLKTSGLTEQVYEGLLNATWIVLDDATEEIAQTELDALLKITTAQDYSQPSTIIAAGQVFSCVCRLMPDDRLHQIVRDRILGLGSATPLSASYADAFAFFLVARCSDVLGPHQSALFDIVLRLIGQRTMMSLRLLYIKQLPRLLKAPAELVEQALVEACRQTELEEVTEQRIVVLDMLRLCMHRDGKKIVALLPRLLTSFGAVLRDRSAMMRRVLSQTLYVLLQLERGLTLATDLAPRIGSSDGALMLEIAKRAQAAPDQFAPVQSPQRLDNEFDRMMLL